MTGEQGSTTEHYKQTARAEPAVTAPFGSALIPLLYPSVSKHRLCSSGSSSLPLSAVFHCHSVYLFSFIQLEYLSR